MMEEQGEIAKRLSQGLCPWCMQPLKETNEPNTRKCTQCSGTVTDIDNCSGVYYLCLIVAEGSLLLHH
jgi:hypothetical protein